MTAPFDLLQGNAPILIAQPHGGTDIPDTLWNHYNEIGQQLADTDWHIKKLYHQIAPDCSSISANFSRYVIDANRDPQDSSLYPGQNTTSLCPLTTFDGHPIYRDGHEPNQDEIRLRLVQWHQPYHAALRQELSRIKQLHGYVILFDCHSIRSKIPFLFEGVLQNFQIGTFDGVSCHSSVEQALYRVCTSSEGYSSVVNGRFKGGWTTRYYGDPKRGVHAIQLEITQSLYMLESPPWSYDARKAEKTRQVLSLIFEELLRLPAGPLLPQ